MATGQASMTASEMAPPTLPTMSMLKMGKSYSRRGYITQCSTCHMQSYPDETNQYSSCGFITQWSTCATPMT